MEFKINISDIKKFAGSVIFDRGDDYYREGLIHSTVQMGPLLKGRCKGSMGYSYFVEVLFDLSEQQKTEIKKTKCSCPYGGACKHIVALLLAWHHESDSFRKQEELAQFFSKQKKEWLIDLILELGEKDSKVLERLYKIRDGKARRSSARKIKT